jgi:hypothetical protein
MILPLDVQIARLRVLTQMALGELPITVTAVYQDEGVFMVELHHITDGPYWFALSNRVMRMNDTCILDVLDEHIEYLLDILWDRLDTF